MDELRPERIPLHDTVSLCNGGTLRAFRNRWRQMPERTRERFREHARQVVRLRLVHLPGNLAQRRRRRLWEL